MYTIFPQTFLVLFYTKGYGRGEKVKTDLKAAKKAIIAFSKCDIETEKPSPKCNK